MSLETWMETIETAYQTSKSKKRNDARVTKKIILTQIVVLFIIFDVFPKKIIRST